MVKNKINDENAELSFKSRFESGNFGSKCNAAREGGVFFRGSKMSEYSNMLNF